MLQAPDTTVTSVWPDTTLNVCTSCRPNNTPKSPLHQRPGYQLYMAMVEAVAASTLSRHVHVQAVPCMSLCPRPCAIAFTSKGRWSYLFGDQSRAVSVSDVPACLELYLSTRDGVLPRQHRPLSLQASILGRIPPQHEEILS